MITIVGMADGKKENLTLRAWDAVQNAPKLFLQTAQIPFGEEVGREYTAFDDLFAKAEDFDGLKKEAAETLVEAAKDTDIVFCVLGDVLQNQLAQATAEKAAKPGIPIEVIAGLPCGGQALSEAMAAGEVALGGAHTISALAYDGTYDRKKGLLIYEIDSAFLAGEIKIQLLRELSEDKTIYIYKENETPQAIALEDLDRQVEYDYSFCAYIPPTPLAAKTGFSYADLVEIMVCLRAKDGCPWDREQTHDSLKRYLVEEAYEVFDAIKAQDMDMLYDELGDVLLQVVFHAEIAKEHRAFDALDISTAICKKMINRHPHVFADTEADTSEKVLKNWEKIKAKEKGIENFRHNLKDVPKAMPALMRAQKVQKRAAACGFDWDGPALPMEKVFEELEELKQDIADKKDPTTEFGDVLFAVTNLARHLKLESETVLYVGVEKFISRFSAMERLAEAQSRSLADMTLEEMDVLWEQAKNDLKNESEF